MTYLVLDDITWADLALSFTAISPEGIFTEAASAFLSELIESEPSVLQVEEIKIILRKPSLDVMLFSLFEELIFLKDTQQILLHPKSIILEYEPDIWALSMILSGEKIDRSRHMIKTDIKAVTMHNLDFSMNESGMWKATIILDL